MLNPLVSTNASVEAQTGDALSAMHGRYSAALRAYFLKRAPAGVEPDDLVQDVFVRLAGRGDVGSIRSIEGYLFQTAANVLRDHARRGAARFSGAHDPYEDDVHGHEDISPERVLLGREALGELIAALDRLPARTRVIFVLHRFEGVSYGGIARRLGVSVSSVEKHMMKALAHVARQMDRRK